MDHIVISGVPAFEGRWPFDLDGHELSTREWGWVKRLAGYLPLTIEEGLSDPELIVVFACIALRRAGKVEPQDVPRVFGQLSDAPFYGSIKMETDVEEAAEGDAGPPAPSSTGNGDSSGAGSKTNSETSPPSPTSFGTPGSAISPSVPLTSASSHPDN